MKSLIGMKIAILAANGFDQQDMTAAQRALIAAGATIRLISTDNGLVNGWDGQGWGHNFPVDAPLNTALGVDFDALVIPGGQRSFDKLKLTAHTKRFIGSFMTSAKPVVAMGESAMVLMEADQRDMMNVLRPQADETAENLIKTTIGHLTQMLAEDKLAA